MDMKICSKCGLLKEITEFYKDQRAKDCHRGSCKTCESLQKKTYTEINKEKLKLSWKIYNETHKAEIKLYAETHKIEKALQCKKYNKDHKDEIALRKKNRKNTDPYDKLHANLRRHIDYSFGSSKDDLLCNYIGCTMKFLTRWFAFLGCDYLIGGLVIDHIKPKASFNFDNRPERYLCYNWKNMRLISSKENRVKYTKIDEELINFYLIIAEVFLEDNKEHIIMNATIYDWVD